MAAILQGADATPPEEMLPVVWPLVAQCPTFAEAAGTVEYLCSLGMPHEALSVVTDQADRADGARRSRGGAAPSARRRLARSRDDEPETTRRHYVVSDEGNARLARLLLRAGADAQAETFGMHAVPCVGFLPTRSEHPRSGAVTARRWARRVRPRAGRR